MPEQIKAAVKLGETMKAGHSVCNLDSREVGTLFFLRVTVYVVEARGQWVTASFLFSLGKR